MIKIICRAARICICAFIFFYASCNLNVDDIPTSFEPVVWKDSMIFLTTDEGPTQVQLWDTETRTLVKQYMFPEHMYFGNAIAVDNERLWITLIGRKEHLVQLDAVSGEVNVINLEIKPRVMQYIEESLWVYDPYSNLGEGIKFLRLNRDGELEQTVTIDLQYIDFVPQEGILLIDGDFLVPIQTFERGGGSDRYYIANLSKGGELTEIPLETLYPGSLLENFSAVVYDSILDPPDPSKNTAFFWYEEGYADVLFTSAALIWRWYYKIESYTPLKLSGPITTYHRHGNRTNLYLSKTGDYLFVGGSMKSRLEDGSSLSGNEISVHPAEGGDELVIFRLWNSNDRYVKRNGETWFAKDIWSWDYLTEKWDFIGEKEAYILDEINLELYRVGVNGDVVLVPPFYDNR